MKVIVPCGGRSSRYPKMPPKWMLPSHDRRPMLSLAVSKLSVSREDLVVTILREHEQRYKVAQGLEAVFGYPVRVVVLDEPTQSQPETVARTLEALALDEPFLIKDSDNLFHLDDIEQDYNYVCVDSLNNFESINPRNKSYLTVDHKDNITNIREKAVISDLFSVGGYYFTQPRQFLDFFNRFYENAASWQKELYVSDIIGAMILDGIPFKARSITSYQDWGTIHEWRHALLSRKAYYVLLDGFLFERGFEFFSPHYSEVHPNPEAVELIQTAVQRGNTVTYLSIRPGKLAELTQGQIKAAGLPVGQVIYECPIAPWVMLTAPHETLPFQTSDAIELHADDPNLREKVLGDY